MPRMLLLGGSGEGGNLGTLCTFHSIFLKSIKKKKKDSSLLVSASISLSDSVNRVDYVILSNIHKAFPLLFLLVDSFPVDHATLLCY